MKDQYNPLYDPLMANNVCMNGQLLLLDLIEKIESYGKLIQSNTDGIFMKVKDMETVEQIKKVAAEWETRTRLDLEWEIFDKIYQKDVNNYIIIDTTTGKYKSKGSYVKKLSNIDYDLPILNKALVDYFVKSIPIEETIHNCNDLREFQKVVKVSKLYSYALHGEVKLPEKVLRVFASTDDDAKGVYKVKGENKIEKLASTPEKCFIYNDNVIGVKIPIHLDKQYYIDGANKRLSDFIDIDENSDKRNSMKDINNLVLKHNDFYDVLEEIFNNKIATRVELIKYTKLDMFSKFGKSKKIINYLEIFKLLYGKKSPKKKTILKLINDVTILNILENESDATETTYKQLNYEKSLRDIYCVLHNEDIYYGDKIRTQYKELGNINFIDPNVPLSNIYVIHVHEAKNVLLTAYSIQNGLILTLKIDRNIYSILGMKPGDIIEAKGFTKSWGSRLVGKDSTGKNMFEPDERKVEYWLTSYEIIDRC